MTHVTYVATVKAKVPQVVRCTYCGNEFLYFMRKTGVGEVERFSPVGRASAEREASELARQSLAAQLTPDNFNVVPCGHCFRFQPYMREQAAEFKYGHNRVLGKLLGLFGLIVLGIGAATGYNDAQHRETGLWVGVAGLGLILLGFWAHWYVRRLLAAYDPNDLPEQERVTRAADRCMTWEQFNRRQAKRIARQYRDHTEDQKRERWLAKAETREPPPPARLWLPPQAFLHGLSVPVRLAPDNEVAIVIAPETEPGKVIDLVPAGRNELPFRVVLLDIFDYYSASPDDED